MSNPTPSPQSEPESMNRKCIHCGKSVHQAKNLTGWAEKKLWFGDNDHLGACFGYNNGLDYNGWHEVADVES